MPVTLAITPAEAAFLEANKIEGVSGDKFTYNPTETSAILAKLPDGEDRARVVNRLTDVATQLGIPNVLFSNSEEKEQPELPLTEAKTSTTKK